MRNILILIIINFFSFLMLSGQCIVTHTVQLDEFGCNSCGSVNFEASSFTLDCTSTTNIVIEVTAPIGFSFDSSSDFQLVSSSNGFNFYHGSFQWVEVSGFETKFIGCYNPNDEETQSISYTLYDDGQNIDGGYIPLSSTYFKEIGINSNSVTRISELIDDEVIPPSGQPYTGRFLINGELLIDEEYFLNSGNSQGQLEMQPGSKIRIIDSHLAINNYRVYSCNSEWQGIKVGKEGVLELFNAEGSDANVFCELGDNCTLYIGETYLHDNEVAIYAKDAINPSVYFTYANCLISNSSRGVVASGVDGRLLLSGHAFRITGATIGIQGISSNIIAQNFTLPKSVISAKTGVLLQFNSSLTSNKMLISGSGSPFQGIYSWYDNTSIALNDVEIYGYSSGIYNMGTNNVNFNIIDSKFYDNNGDIASIGDINGRILSTSFDGSSFSASSRNNILLYGSSTSSLGLDIVDCPSFLANGTSSYSGRNIQAVNLNNLNISNNNFFAARNQNTRLVNSSYGILRRNTFQSGDINIEIENSPNAGLCTNRMLSADANNIRILGYNPDSYITNNTMHAQEHNLQLGSELGFAAHCGNQTCRGNIFDPSQANQVKAIQYGPFDAITASIFTVPFLSSIGDEYFPYYSSETLNWFTADDFCSTQTLNTNCMPKHISELYDSAIERCNLLSTQDELNIISNDSIKCANKLDLAKQLYLLSEEGYLSADLADCISSLGLDNGLMFQGLISALDSLDSKETQMFDFSSYFSYLASVEVSDTTQELSQEYLSEQSAVLNTMLDNIFSSADTATINKNQYLDSLLLQLQGVIPECHAEEVMHDAIDGLIISKKSNSFQAMPGRLASSLREHSELCPYTSGKGVYIARYLVAGMDERIVEYDDACSSRSVDKREDELPLNNFSILNPVESVLEITSYESNEEYSLQCINIEGILVYSASGLSGNTKHSVDHLSSGLYIARITNGATNSTSTLRFVKQ